MLIPIRCFTCGKVLADKWVHYEAKCAQLQDDNDGNVTPAASSPAVVEAGVTARGRILDELLLHRLCCRRHFLTHVDLVD